MTEALDQAGLKASDVDLIMSTTVTGVAVPSLEARIAPLIGLRPDVIRVPLFGLGCMAGASGIARLHDYLTGHPDAVAVLISVELCSLTVQRGDRSMANLVSSGLFGDGGAAVVAVGENRAAAMGLTGPTVLASRTRLYPDTSRTMGWDVGTDGLRIVLGADVPQIVTRYLGLDIKRFLADHGLDLSDISALGRTSGRAEGDRGDGGRTRRRTQRTRRHLELAADHRQPVLGVGAARTGRHPARGRTPGRRLRSPDGHGPGIQFRTRTPAMVSYFVLIGLVGVERIVELVLAQRHLRWYSDHGGQEYGAGHYPVMVVLHTGLLAGCVFEVLAGRPFLPALGWPMFALVVLAQALRWWCIATLGPRWTTRVVVLPGVPPVRRGPYRMLNHPNYLAVVVEGAAPAVGALGVPHRDRLHDRQRDPAAHPDPGREHRTGHSFPVPRTPMIDLLVAGGGPVGLVTALLAQRAGLATVVLEPRAGPVDKACGEGLMPGALGLLRELGVDPAGPDFRGIRYVDHRRTVDAAFRDGPGRGVRRTTLHAALSAAVGQAGIEIRTGRVEDIIQSDGHLRAAGIQARYLAAADGLHSPIARRLGLTTPVQKNRRWGQRQHFWMAPWSDLVEVHWAAGAEAYVTPVAARPGRGGRAQPAPGRLRRPPGRVPDAAGPARPAGR